MLQKLIKKLGDLSLGRKFLAIICLLLVSSLTTYLVLAVSLFDQDKQAFIYEGQGSLVGALADQSTADLKSNIQTIEIMALTEASSFQIGKERQTALESIFNNNASLIDLSIIRVYKDGKEKRSFNMRKLQALKPHNLGNKFLGKLYKKYPVNYQTIANDNLEFKNVSLKRGIPVARLGLLLTRKEDLGKGAYDTYAIAHMTLDKKIKAFGRSEGAQVFLMDGFGNIIAHPIPRLINNHHSLSRQPYVKSILNAATATGAFQSENIKGNAVIISYSKLSLGNLYIVSVISRDKAFIATKRLKEKSVVFALLIVVIAFIISFLFTKQITASLKVLFMATRKIGKGDFSISVPVKNKDEVGALSYAFNSMSRRIVELLEATADNARMEKELETAQLVQEQFFPIDELTIGAVDISAYFEAASECGGDWWGHIKTNDNKLILLIGDATGHGVPAALITASAHSCCHTVQNLIVRKSLDLDPAFIMETLNSTIYSAAEGRVKMTFFITIIDLDTGEARYANASHELPFIARLPEGETDMYAKRKRKNLDTMDGEAGPILGDAAASKYENYSYKFLPGDVAFWYTDGLTECRSPEDEEYGEQRLMRAVVQAGTKTPDEAKTDIIGAAHEFYSTRPLDDDITFMVVRLGEFGQGSSKSA